MTGGHMDLQDLSFQLHNVLWILCNIVLFIVLGRAGSVKYLFALGICGMCLIFLYKKANYTDRLLFFLPWLLYIFAGEFFCIWNNSLNSDSLKNPMFYLLPLLLAFFMAALLEEKLTEYLDMQFWGIAIVFLAWGVRHFSRANLMESQYAFILGAYVLYYVYRRRYFYTMAALVLLLLADKRIGMLAAFAVTAFVFCVQLFRSKRLRCFFVKSVYWIMTVIMVLYIYVIKNGALAAFTAKYKINTMGRANIYTRLARFFEFSPSYPGAGLGMGHQYVLGFEIPSYTLAHNDILVLYMEIGFACFIAYWLLYGWVLGRLSRRIQTSSYVAVMGMFLYSFLIMTTDNVSIYINYFYPFYMIVFALMREREEKEVGKKRYLDAKDG